MAAAAVVVSFLFVLLRKLSGGGRWGIGMPLAEVDRFLNGEGFFYSTAQTGYVPSSSYFPATALFFIPIRSMVPDNSAETLLIFLAVLLSFACIGIFCYIASRSCPNRSFLVIMACFLVTTGFPSLRSYMAEWHPDIFVLLFGAIAALLMEAFVQSERHRMALGCGIVAALAIACLFKQNAVFLCIGFLAFVLRTHAIPRSDKAKLILFGVFAGLMALAIVMAIPGCFVSTVTVNAGHAYLSLREWMRFLLVAIRDNIVFWLLLLVYCVLLRRRRLPEKSFLEGLWLYGAIGWFLFSMFGSIKDGANNGNIEAAMIALLPYALTAAYAMRDFTFAGRQMNPATWSNGTQKLLAGAMVLFCSTLLGRSAKQVPAYFARCSDQQMMIEWLDEHHRGQDIALCSTYYFYGKDASIRPSTDFMTMEMFDMAGWPTEDEAQKLYETYRWPVIVTVFKEKHPAKYPNIFKDYRQSHDSKIPKELEGMVWERIAP